MIYHLNYFGEYYEVDLEFQERTLKSHVHGRSPLIKITFLKKNNVDLKDKVLEDVQPNEINQNIASYIEKSILEAHRVVNWVSMDEVERNK